MTNKCFHHHRHHLQTADNFVWIHCVRHSNFSIFSSETINKTNKKIPTWKKPIQRKSSRDAIFAELKHFMYIAWTHVDTRSTQRLIYIMLSFSPFDNNNSFQQDSCAIFCVFIFTVLHSPERRLQILAITMICFRILSPSKVIDKMVSMGNSKALTHNNKTRSSK